METPGRITGEVPNSEPKPNLPEAVGLPDEIKEQDVLKDNSDELISEVRDRITTTTNVVASGRQKLLLGDFDNLAISNGNKIELPVEKATELNREAEEFVTSRRFIKPWYFVAGNITATGYNSPLARNRSTQTAIRTLEDGRRVFLIDPRGSAFHRLSDTIMRRAFGHPARKVSVDEWNPLMHEKSEIPVFTQDDTGQEKPFPYSNVVAVPYIPNVNGFDYFANNKKIDFPEEFKWAGEVTLEDKIQTGEEAMRVAQDLHGRGKAWGELAVHNLLIAKNSDGKINVIPADTEVEYDDSIDNTEKYARDILDLTVTIAGGLNKSEGLTGQSYDGVIKRLFDTYENREVVERVGSLIKPLTFKQKVLYRFYESLRYNGLPYEQFAQITDSIKRVSSLPAEQKLN